MPYPSQGLLQDPLFAYSKAKLSTDEQALLSYRRARAIGRVYNLVEEDITRCSAKFWAMHSDPIGLLDGAAFTLLTIHYNLALGTILQLVSRNTLNNISTLVEALLSYDVIGQFLLTELDHGLDIAHMDTTATRLPSGGFMLHTPHDGAAKWMPPTIPQGVPCVGVVFAKLMVDGTFHGIRAFLVPLNDGFRMCAGVSARLAPYRGGSSPVNHSLTFFHNVHLPSYALLGEADVDTSSCTLFERTIWRVAVGGLALSSYCIPALQLASTTAALYSLRRMVGGPGDTKHPIFDFRTQHRPILVGFSLMHVARAFQKWAIRCFTDKSLDSRVRHGIAIVFKATVIRRTLALYLDLSERLGAQGLFGYNRLATLHTDMRGISIAEGDTLATSIRLATELLLRRYAMPCAMSSSLLSSHETGLVSENETLLKAFHGHRSADFQNYVLPQCQSIVEAIGLRMAYDAAVMDNVPSYLIDLYEITSVKEDLAWYVENGLLTREAFFEREHRCVQEALLHMKELLKTPDELEYISAPSISETRFKAFLSTWEMYDSEEKPKAVDTSLIFRGVAKL